MAKTNAKEVSIEIEPLKAGRVEVWLEGITPLILHRLAAKARRELLYPRGRKGKAERQQSMKHDPITEYRDSMHTQQGSGHPTRLVFPSSSIKAAIADAALETAGTNRSQIGRLVWVEGMTCDLYGVPELYMTVVRSADIGKTPDIRTRAIVPQWCLKVCVQFVQPQLSEQALFRLLANGGVIIGLGDFRQQKGKGNFGQFSVSTEADCRGIVRDGGRVAQDKAINKPKCFDADTEELLAWFNEEVKSRGQGGMLGDGK